jgi:hypothetical protein
MNSLIDEFMCKCLHIQAARRIKAIGVTEAFAQIAIAALRIRAGLARPGRVRARAALAPQSSHRGL